MFKFKDYFICIICLSLIPIGLFFWYENTAKASNKEDATIELNFVQEIIEDKDDTEINIDSESIELIEEANKNTKIVLNFAGDCTLGTDSSFTYNNQFPVVYNKVNDNGYFFSNMQSLFKNDDLTIVNLEGPLTNSTKKIAKKFNFKGPPEYADILLSGDIDVVNLANNHTKDYGEQGYKDTLQTLQEYNIPYFGYDNYYIYEKDGVKIGFAGLTTIWDGTIYKRIDEAFDYLNSNNCDIKIFTFHWGVEREYKQNATQQKVGHYTIDKGAELVVGHHAHVLQGIEEYKGKYIVYGLANFCFGGNLNPPDKDTMVFNYTLDFEDGIYNNSTAIIFPARVSSVNNRNDFKPTLAVQGEYYRILNKILKYSNVKTDENGVILKNIES